MTSIFLVDRRALWRALFLLALAVLAASIVFGGPAWLLIVPAMFALGRSYGSRPGVQGAAGHTEYGVGAALAGFMPAARK